MKLLLLLASLSASSLLLANQVECKQRECRVFKELGSLEGRLELARYRHGHCSLLEFAAFLHSDKLGGFVELRGGSVSNGLSQCLSGHPYSYVHIDFPCGALSLEFVRSGSGVRLARLRFGHYENDQTEALTYGQLELNQFLAHNQSYECLPEQAYEPRPCLAGVNCQRLHLQRLRLEPFRGSRQMEFSFSEVKKCEPQLVQNLKQEFIINN